MPTLDILFIIIISVMAVSIFLSVVDWIYLASLASKATILEREIEKKSLEFDALKKERYNAQHSSEGSASVIESTEQLTGSTSSPAAGSEDTIQIVRNVRGNFERAAQYSTAHGYPEEQLAVSPPASLNDVALDYQAAAPSYTTVPHQASLQPPEKPNDIRIRPSGDTGKIYLQPTGADGSFTETPVSGTQPDSCILKLYSVTTKDADFQTLWKKITGIFQTRQNPHIIIDLSGINFMYDNEMDYLEKIKYLIAGRGGSFGFINCDQELLSLFNNRPQLHSIVKQKVV